MALHSPFHAQLLQAKPFEISLRVHASHEEESCGMTQSPRVYQIQENHDDTEEA